MAGARRTTSRIALVAVLVVTISAAVTAAPSAMMPAAQAMCRGAGNPVITKFVDPDGRVLARENAVSGTCNRDGTYRGKIADTFRDGRCALVRFKDAGSVNTQGIDCAVGDGAVRYSFNDRNGDHRAKVKVCPQGLCRYTEWKIWYGY